MRWVPLILLNWVAGSFMVGCYVGHVFAHPLDQRSPASPGS